MGNRAIIKGAGTDLGVYVHWNGGFESVQAFVEYCRLKQYRSLEKDSYGLARLCQVIGNFFGGSTSLGIEKIDKELNEKIVSKWYLDNGVYEIEDWKIVKHWNNNLQNVEMEYKSNEYKMIEYLKAIDECQPEEEQLGEEFFDSEIVQVTDLVVGDKVYVPDSYDGKYNVFEVVGIGEDVFCNGYNVKGIPYVNKYEHNGKYDWNCNNYLKDKEYRILRR